VKSALTFVAVVVVSAGVLAGGGAAQADEVWYQGYERASSDEVCTAQPGETPWQDSWGPDASWHPSWEMWANGGRGGWTCGRAITWARDPGAAGVAASRSYSLGDIGPGGGIVFYKDLAQPAGKQYMEAAPNTWSGGSADPGIAWCNTSTDITGAVGTLIGTGAANTTAMLGGCASGAGVSAHAYDGGGLNDWFLPSMDELNALCSYSRVAPSPNPGEPCQTHSQDPTFAAGAYGFDFSYWSSSQAGANYAYYRVFLDGSPAANNPNSTLKHVRPVRAF
jgi:hypothetical protein